MKTKTKTMTMTIILYLYGLSAAAIFMMYFAPANQAAGGIPEEAIRIRVIAHDNSQEEQAKKENVHLAVAGQIGKWAGKASSAAESRVLIQENMDNIQKTASEAAGQQVNVTFRKEEFPPKQFGRFVYPPGDYESLVVTIGEGKGENWWCVLYPALCFPEEEQEKTEYKWAIIELWGQLRN